MSNNNLFFYKGEGKIESQQLALSSERTVIIRDACSELVIDGIRNIEISHKFGNRLRLKIGPKISFYPLNKKIAINDTEGSIIITIIDTEEQLREFETIADEQTAKALKDYIHENVPNLYTKESLNQKNLNELREIKENMDDLANSY
ncbi:MAG: hypothetical protein APF77_17080 [Clostridia bacterium BRH_c25]|nr:MAG: hypothetical protein APF77_17080 [Clostridia bacterium BRH_c25]